MDGGSGASALAALGVVVATVARIIYRVDRYERARQRQQRYRRGAPAASRPPRVVPVTRPAASQQVLLGPEPRPEPEDVPPTSVEVPQRLFVHAARIVTQAGYATPSLLRRRLRVDGEALERLMLALQGAGVIGARYGANGQARVLVQPAELGALFARFGIVEDEVPPGFE